MKKTYKPEKKEKTETRDYSAIVNQCEVIYGQQLPDDIFNLGADIAKNERCWGVVSFCPKTWTAWMRKAKLYETQDAVYIGIDGSQNRLWIDNIFKHFHSVIARHKDKKVFYRLDGKTLDIAGYGSKTYQDLTDEQKKYAEDCFAEARANVAKFINMGKDAFKQ
jgi:hypothetical protein